MQKRIPRPVIFVLHLVAVMLAAFGGQEIAVYVRTTSDLLTLKSALISELESEAPDAQVIEKTRQQIAYFESGGHFDRSVYRGLVLIAAAFSISIVVNRYARRPKKGELGATDNPDDVQ